MTDVQGLVTTNATFTEFNTAGQLMDVTTAIPVGGTTVTWWPNGYWWYATPNSKTEVAYRVLRGLMKAKVIRVNTLPKFFEAMDAVVAAL